jgi:transposase
MNWCRIYRDQGVAGLVDKRKGGNRAKLTATQIEELGQKLRQYTPAQVLSAEGATSEYWSVESLQCAVRKWYGVTYKSRTSYYELLDACDYSCQRPSKVYKSRSEAKVADFEEQFEKKTIDTVQKAPTTVFLVQDEASLYLQATTMRVWAPRGQTPVVRADPGRKSIHFFGTLNLHTGQEIVMRAKKMNAKTTSQHLLQILEAVPDVPIVLLWDRAPWHRGEPIRDVLAAHPRLELIYFPVAAPDLNPQEHVWKAARRAVSHNHSLSRLDDLADRFEKYLNENTFECSMLTRYGFNSLRPIFN